MQRPKKVLLAAIAGLEIASTIGAWRDLGHRAAADVRGKKAAWRLFMSINPGNSLLYWAFGRRGRRRGVR